jgi:hypothetical protein
MATVLSVCLWNKVFWINKPYIIYSAWTNTTCIYTKYFIKIDYTALNAISMESPVFDTDMFFLNEQILNNVIIIKSKVPHFEA